MNAACRDSDPEAFFAQTSDDIRSAKRVCRHCPVRYECLVEALDGPVHTGVWGGMSERERRQLLRRYPQVRCWRRALFRPVAHSGPLLPGG